MGFANRLVTIKTENLVYIHANESVTPMFERDGAAYVDGTGADYFFQTGTTGFAGANAITKLSEAVANDQVTFSTFIAPIIADVILQG